MPLLTYFPNVTSLLLDSNLFALSLLHTPLPNVRKVEFISERALPGDSRDVVQMDGACRRAIEHVLRLPKLEELVLPREACWKLGTGSLMESTIEQRCEARGIRLRWNEEPREEWI